MGVVAPLRKILDPPLINARLDLRVSRVILHSLIFVYLDVHDRSVCLPVKDNPLCITKGSYLDVHDVLCASL